MKWEHVLPAASDDTFLGHCCRTPRVHVVETNDDEEPSDKR